jgi:hypothetical protein
MVNLARRLIDLGADISISAVPALASDWSTDFYVSETAMHDAVVLAKSFNLIHLATSTKIDIFVCGSDPFNTSVMNRRLLKTIGTDEDSVDAWFASPEDVILHKLVWYRKGGETSERQWRDVVGVLEQQHDRLDFAYLTKWSDRLQVQDLLERIRSGS